MSTVSIVAASLSVPCGSYATLVHLIYEFHLNAIPSKFRIILKGRKNSFLLLIFILAQNFNGVFLISYAEIATC